MWPVEAGQLVFDVGANRGLFARACLERGATVVCVEPQDDLCVELAALGCEVVHAAVGRCEGIVTLHTSDDSLYASARAGWVDGHRSYHGWDSRHRTRVPMVTLDSLIVRFGMPDFIKVDTEGLEDEVMVGLSVAPSAMSLEYHGGRYAVQAAAGVTGRALRCAAELADYRYRFAAESVRWVSGWVDLNDALGMLDGLDWGDVYVASPACTLPV